MPLVKVHYHVTHKYRYAPSTITEIVRWIKTLSRRGIGMLPCTEKRDSGTITVVDLQNGPYVLRGTMYIIIGSRLNPLHLLLRGTVGGTVCFN
jgi:hypothetical protein